MDFLKSAVASAIAKGPLAAYVVGDRVDIDASIWTLSNCTKRVGRRKFRCPFNAAADTQTSRKTTPNVAYSVSMSTKIDPVSLSPVMPSEKHERCDTRE